MKDKKRQVSFWRIEWNDEKNGIVSLLKPCHYWNQIRLPCCNEIANKVWEKKFPITLTRFFPGVILLHFFVFLEIHQQFLCTIHTLTHIWYLSHFYDDEKYEMVICNETEDTYLYIFCLPAFCFLSCSNQR